MKAWLERVRKLVLEEVDQVSRFNRLLLPGLRFVYHVLGKAWEDNCAQRAAALSFFTLLNIFPIAGLLLFGLAHSTPFKQDVAEVESATIEQLMTPAAREVVSDLFASIARNLHVLGTGLSAALALLVLLLVSSSLILMLDRYLNDIWKAPGSLGGIFSRVSLLWLLIAVVPVFMGASFALSAWMKKNLAALRHFERLALPYCITLLAFLVLYKYVPRVHVRLKVAFASAAAAALLWEAAKLGLNRYAQAVFTKSIVGKLYGSLALIPIGMIWVYYSWLILLLGAEFAYVLQNLGQLHSEARLRWSLGKGFVPMSRQTAISLLLEVGRGGTGAAPIAAADLVSLYQVHPDQARSWFECLRDSGILEVTPDEGLRSLKSPGEIPVSLLCELYGRRFVTAPAGTSAEAQAWAKEEETAFLGAWGQKTLAEIAPGAAAGRNGDG
jgi:membrane protein